MTRISGDDGGSLIDRTARRLLALIDTVHFVACWPVSWACRLTGSDAGALIEGDVEHWLAVLGAGNVGSDEPPPAGVEWRAVRSSSRFARQLGLLLWAFPEFRAVYYHRLQHGDPAGALAARLLRAVFKPREGLSLFTAEIGSGLFVAHGHSTILAADRIGSNCYVHQGVTVGWDYKSERKPIIGDGVFIGANAVILGAVTVGDFARIGANAVVLRDVPAWSTAVGAPARVISMRAEPAPR